MREPYRVSEIQKDRQGQQGSHQHHFGEENGEEAYQKFLKASEELKKRKSVILASQIMNKTPLLLEDHLSFDDAWERVKDREVHDFAIVSSKGKLRGIISRSELQSHLEKGSQKTLKEMARRNVLCAEPETNMQDVIKVFFDKTVQTIPIVDADNQVLGVLNRSDLFRTMLKVLHFTPGS